MTLPALSMLASAPRSTAPAPVSPSASTATSIPRELAAWRAAIDEELARVLPPAHAAPVRVHAAMRHAVLGGGKRVRPLLAVAIGRALRVPLADLVPAAACIELVHASSLVLDDLPAMDDDDTRRGRPSCHRAYGEAAAILASSGLLFLAFERLSALAAGRSSAALALVGDFAGAAGTTTGLIAGQARDLWPETTGDGAEELERTHEAKTGSLFGLAAAVAARAAGFDDARVDRLRAAGNALGVAFQIADDVDDAGAGASSDERLARRTYTGIAGAVGGRARARALRGAAVDELVALTGDPSLAWLAAVVP